MTGPLPVEPAAALLGLVLLAVSTATLLLVARRTDPVPRRRRPRPVSRRRVTPAEVAADPLLGDIAAMLSYYYLHIDPRSHAFTQLDTDQRDLFADLVDADHVNRPGGGPDEPPWLIPRWWRDDTDTDPATRRR